MDRNLGALSADPAADWDKTVGLYYQFGRKDPAVFSGTYDIYGNKCSICKSVGEQLSYMKSVLNPCVFLKSNSNIDWLSSNKYWKNIWNTPDWYPTSGKSLFDPCPQGWELVAKNTYDAFVFNATVFWSTENKGIYYYPPSVTASSIFFPAGGASDQPIGYSRRCVGTNGDYWMNYPSKKGDEAMAFSEKMCFTISSFNKGWEVHTGGYGGTARNSMFTTRCIKSN